MVTFIHRIDKLDKHSIIRNCMTLSMFPKIITTRVTSIGTTSFGYGTQVSCREAATDQYGENLRRGPEHVWT